MPTTLWFSTQNRKQRMLDNLIACGQFTVCRNLIRYVERIQAKEELWGSLTDAEKQSIEDLNKRLRTDFQQFIDTPLWLVDSKKGA